MKKNLDYTIEHMPHGYSLRPRKTKRQESPVAPKTKRQRKTVKPQRTRSPYQNFRTIRASPFRASPRIKSPAGATLQINHGKGYLTAVMEHFQIRPVLDKTGQKIVLGEGTYNVAYLVQDKFGTQQHVLRIMRPTCEQNNINDMSGELRLTKRFSNLNIGAPVSKTVMYKMESSKGTMCYGTAMLMAKMDSDLHGVLFYDPYRPSAPKTKVAFNANTLAKTLIKSIHNLANEGYMCADIKPQNILVKGNVAYMADFDTKFCGKGSFIDRIAKKYGIPKASLTKRRLDGTSWKNLRDMYSRAMVFMLMRFIARRKEYRNYKGILFTRALADTYERYYLSKKRGVRTIMLGGKQVSAMNVLRYSIPGFDYENQQTGQVRKYNVKNMVQHYHGRNIFVGKLYKKWFGSFR